MRPVGPSRSVLSIILAGGFLFVATCRFLMLSTSPEPNGADGIYYVLQAASIAERGVPTTNDHSPVHYLNAGLILLGLPAIAAVKLCAALLGAGIPVMTLFAARAAGASDKRAIAAAVAVALSPGLHWATIDYLKQMAALSAALGAAACLSPLHLRWRWRRGVSALACAALAAWFHGSGLLVVLALAAGLRAPHLYAAWQRVPHLAVRIGLLGAGAIGATILLMAVPAAQWQRLDGAWNTGFVLPAFSPAIRHGLPKAAWIEWTVLCVAVPVSLLALSILRRRGFSRPSGACVLAVPAALLALPVWNMEVLDLGWRLFLASLPWTYSVIVILLPPLPMPFRQPRIMTAAGSLGLALSAVFCIPGLGPYDPRRDPPYRMYRLIARRIELPADSLLIVHQPLSQVYTLERDFRDAMQYLPEFRLPANLVWRLARGSSAAEINAVLDRASGARDLGSGYTLLREDQWQAFLSQVGPERSEELSGFYNPSSHRPAWLAERNREAAARREAALALPAGVPQPDTP